MNSQEPPVRGPVTESSGDDHGTGPARRSLAQDTPALRTRRNPFTGRVSYVEPSADRRGLLARFRRPAAGAALELGPSGGIAAGTALAPPAPGLALAAATVPVVSAQLGRAARISSSSVASTGTSASAAIEDLGLLRGPERR